MHASETMLIGGEWVEAAGGRTLEVRNPATDEVIADVPDAGAEDVDRAVRAARGAFDGGWRDATAQHRGRVLFRIGEAIRARRAELAELETLNSGKPIVEAELDIDDAATSFEYSAAPATTL